ncbi:MAG TPA: hypothetical protein DCE47_13240, partial [Planctomycetaceae bacterium]|nr:hypothetical protein [Planctomycetaceae bacterium]
MNDMTSPVLPLRPGPFGHVSPRRQFLARTSGGLGAAALAGLLQDQLRAAPGNRRPGSLATTHIPARAKRVIYLFMAG